jgi:CheY-like chemotaxis protein
MPSEPVEALIQNDSGGNMPEAHLPPEETSSAPERPETILLVEDDPVQVKLVQTMLQDAGYATHCAQDGRDCLKLVADLLPDIILMDVVMPHLNGIETCRHLKSDERFRRIPVIFVTGYTDEETLQAAFEAGGKDYVRKPVSRVELLARVRTSLSENRILLKLAREEKLKTALELAGGICHELNQPLQYVLGAVQLIMMDFSDDDVLYPQLDAIRARIEQMGEITRNLSAITRFRTRKYVGDQDILDIDQSTAGHE